MNKFYNLFEFLPLATEMYVAPSTGIDCTSDCVLNDKRTSTPFDNTATTYGNAYAV